MAIINAIAIGKAKGSLGNMTLRYVKGDTIGSQKVLKKGKGGTRRQVKVRARWGNIVNMYKSFGDALLLAFETAKGRQSDFNMFCGKNISRSKVYLTAGEVRQGGAVVFPAMISEGSLPSISLVLATGDVFESNINVGSIAITASTTLKAVSTAIVNNNRDFQFGDQLSAFIVKQQMNSETFVPYVEVEKIEFTLDGNDEDTLFRDIAGAEAFSVVDGYLAFGQTVNGGVAYVHSRKTADGLKTSTQWLAVQNAILPTYESVQQMNAALVSYHADDEEPFLVPNIPDTPLAPEP